MQASDRSSRIRCQRGETGPLLKEAFQHIPELSFVCLSATEYEDARWRTAQAYDGVLTSHHRLQTVIKAKEAKDADPSRSRIDQSPFTI